MSLKKRLLDILYRAADRNDDIFSQWGKGMTHDRGAHDHHNHSHGHGHSHAPANFTRAFAIGLILNLGFVGAEAFYGLLAHSIALIADAGHNLSDVLGLALAWGAVILSQRPASRRHTYGWRRSSILAAFLNAVFLFVVTGGIAWEAIQRFWMSGNVQGEIVIWVALVGIAINTATALLFMSGRKGDMNIRAAFLHMAADALVSVGVVLAGIGILATGWQWLDPAFSLIVSAVIIVNTWQLLKESFNLALDAVPENVDERAVRAFLLERPGVQQIHDLHIWGMSTTEVALTAHLIMPTGHPGDDFLASICKELHDHFRIEHTTIQIELGDTAELCQLDCDRQFVPNL
jgi:cobalt-zinc-cadmium efflux system protein